MHVLQKTVVGCPYPLLPSGIVSFYFQSSFPLLSSVLSFHLYSSRVLNIYLYLVYVLPLNETHKRQDSRILEILIYPKIQAL